MVCHNTSVWFVGTAEELGFLAKVQFDKSIYSWGTFTRQMFNWYILSYKNEKSSTILVTVSPKGSRETRNSKLLNRKEGIKLCLR